MLLVSSRKEQRPKVSVDLLQWRFRCMAYGTPILHACMHKYAQHLANNLILVLCLMLYSFLRRAFPAPVPPPKGWMVSHGGMHVRYHLHHVRQAPRDILP